MPKALSLIEPAIPTSSLVIALLFASTMLQAAAAPVNIIFDTDMGGDCDDVGALFVLHEAVERGEAKLLATMGGISSEAIAPCSSSSRARPYGGRRELIIARRGYDTAELTRGQGLLNTASAAAQAAVRAVYQGLAKTARTIFRRDRPSRVLLGLVGPEPRKQADFEQAARTLFNTSAYTPLITTKLVDHEYDSARLSQERSLINEWVTQQNYFTELAGTSEDATAAQTAAMTALIDWASEYIRHARIVMACWRSWGSRSATSRRRLSARAGGRPPRPAARNARD